ncbi:nitroreductase family protein [Streptomyces sp. NPDC048720]|uniref:nitroreductase family protein n=1 Tax=Streptomyces sp. NPDC048720 TaxID=3365588 RepID=UPI0037235927
MAFAAAWAPSGSNLQPWHTYVVTGVAPAEIKKRAGERLELAGLQAGHGGFTPSGPERLGGARPAASTGASPPWPPSSRPWTPSATDTDSSGASATTGSPIIGLAGARLPIDRATGQPLPVKVRAGTVWQLNDNGRMDVLHTSAEQVKRRSGLRPGATP